MRQVTSSDAVTGEARAWWATGTVVGGFLAGVLAIVLFGWLANVVTARGADQLDAGVLLWLRRADAPWMTWLAQGISLFGSEALAFFVGLSTLVLARRRRWGVIAALLLVVIGAQVLNGVLKEVFQRTRPSDFSPQTIPSQVFSFPSGHAMVSASLYLFLGRAGWLVLRRGWRRAAWLASMLLLVALIGWSRLYLGLHYLTDVIAGYVAGLIWVDAVLLGTRVLGLLRTRRARRMEPPSQVC